MGSNPTLSATIHGPAAVRQVRSSTRGIGFDSANPIAPSIRIDTMTFEVWKARSAEKAKRALERKTLEATFNAEILRRHQAGESKKEIVASLGISRELFNRVTRAAPLRPGRAD